MMQNPTTQAVKLWDLPTRLFHWSLLILIAVGWWSSTEDGDMALHFRCGYAVLALLLFRLSWGVMGSSSARFAGFIASPRAVLSYLVRIKNKDAVHHIGHNPAAGWMVLALIGTVFFIVVSGLLSNDDMMLEGPFANDVGKSISDLATAWHEQNFYGLLGLVAVHIAAILAYLFFKQENLLRPMLTGIKQLPQEVSVPTIHLRSSWLALLLFCIASVAVWLLLKMA
jgi:cytochrome b